MAYAATRGHVESHPALPPRAISGSVNPTTAGVCVDCHGPCYHRGHGGADRRELVPSLAGHLSGRVVPLTPSSVLGRTDPTPSHACRGAEAEGLGTGELALTFT